MTSIPSPAPYRDCTCNFCVTGERDGLGHDDGPQPEPWRGADEHPSADDNADTAARVLLGRARYIGLRGQGPRSSDPWQWLHDNEFSWDDVNAIAAIFQAGGFDVVDEQGREAILEPARAYISELEARVVPLYNAGYTAARRALGLEPQGDPWNLGPYTQGYEDGRRDALRGRDVP